MFHQDHTNQEWDDADRRDEEADSCEDNPPPDNSRLAEVKAMIAQELARGQLSDEQADTLLARTGELEQRMTEEEQALAARHFPDEFDAFLAGKALYDKHIKARRAIEFATLGIDLGGLAADWDHLIRNVSNPLWDEGRHAAMWRSLSREQQAEFKERVLAKGEFTPEQLDRLIAENWE